MRSRSKVHDLPIEQLAQLAKGGDGVAHDELVARLYPSLFRLSAALVTDPTIAERTTKQAIEAALEIESSSYTGAVINEVRRLGSAQRSVSVVPSIDVDEQDRTVLMLCDVEGRSYHDVARLLDESPGEIAVRHARARDQLGIQLRASRCHGWQLVSRHDTLSEPEQQAADSHLELCKECREAFRDRAIARARVLAALPPAAKTAVGVAGLATGIFALIRRPEIVAGGVAVVAAAVTALVSFANSASPLDSSPPQAVADAQDINTPDGGPADVGELIAGPTASPLRDADAATRPEPAVSGVDQPNGLSSAVGDTGSAATQDGNLPRPSDQDAQPAAPQGPPAYLAADTRYGPGITIISDFLDSVSYETTVEGGGAVTRASLLAGVASATTSGAGTAVIHLTLDSGGLENGPSIEAADGSVAAADIASKISANRPVVLVLDLLGPTEIDPDPYLSALQGPNRIVIVSTGRTAVLDGGQTPFASAFWEDALIGGAGDENGDGSITVEEAFAYATAPSLTPGWTSLAAMDDQISGEVALG